MRGPGEGVEPILPEALPVWTETMAKNWLKVKGNFKLIGKLIEEIKGNNCYSFDTLAKEFGVLARKVAIVDTRIGENTTEEGTWSVWEAVGVI